MNWLLVVLVMNTPLKTDLVFQSLDSCLAAETEMRSKWADLYNRAVAAKMSQESLDMIKKQMPHGTCIPTKQFVRPRMEPLAKIPKYSIALEHLDRGIELYLRGDSYYSALHLGGAAEEILAVYVREVQEAPAFDQYKDMCVAFSAHESAKEKSAAEKWIYDRMTYAKNSAKHKRGKNDNTVQFDQKEEAYDVIDRAISTYIQLLSYYNLPYLSSLQDFDAQRLAERNS